MNYEKFVEISVLRNCMLNLPIRGEKYWVIRYTEGLENPLLPDDFIEAIFIAKVGVHYWWKQPTYKTEFTSEHYMEVPKL